jgi:hypothetical protein
MPAISVCAATTTPTLTKDPAPMRLLREIHAVGWIAVANWKPMAVSLIDKGAAFGRAERTQRQMRVRQRPGVVDPDDGPIQQRGAALSR